VRLSAATAPVAPGAKVIWRLVLRSFILSYQHSQLGLAKAVAYSALLSMFPLLTTAATVLVHANAANVSNTIYEFLSQILPPGTRDLVFYYFAIKGEQPILLPVTGMLLSIWAASGAFITLMDGFRAAYRIPAGRPFLKERMVAILLVFSAALLVLLASVLVLFGTRLERLAGRWLGLIPAGADLQGWLSVAGLIVRFLISLGSIALGAAILYYFGPNRRQQWRHVWPGAVFATALWFGAGSLFAWYVQNIAQYNVMYGSIAAVILLLVWMYLLAVIAFVGCEFNTEYERLTRKV
jgi:membrane protein